VLRANTFSICAVNPATGEAGVAVASKCLSVGALVCYARPGVGALATQACVNPDFGPQGLDLLAGGLSSEEVVRRLTDQDVTVTADEEVYRKLYGGEGMTVEGADFFRDSASNQIVWLSRRIRQLGVVDRTGRAATFTGERTQPWSGDITGDGFCCQGNLLAGEEVVRTMAEAFERERGSSEHLVAPLLAAIAAGDAAGGDKRGKQAAAILVVRDRGHWSGSDNWCNVRVDDHADPVGELARILRKVGFVN
jgi:uncharacterized Ntn-hydrolase superfamily protein